MSVTVIFGDVIVVVFPVASAAVVWWVDIDAVYLSLVKVQKGLQSVMVLTLNHQLSRLAPATGGRTLRAWSMPGTFMSTAHVNEPSTLGGTS